MGAAVPPSKETALPGRGLRWTAQLLAVQGAGIKNRNVVVPVGGMVPAGTIIKRGNGNGLKKAAA
jgi:hypothetical protein